VGGGRARAGAPASAIIAIASQPDQRGLLGGQSCALRDRGSVFSAVEAAVLVRVRLREVEALHADASARVSMPS
jgi:hypothetical protein